MSIQSNFLYIKTKKNSSFFLYYYVFVKSVNMNSKLTENINNQKESLEQSSIEKKVLEGSIDSNYDLNLADGIEAYYSERYGWTLRRKTI